MRSLYHPDLRTRLLLSFIGVLVVAGAVALWLWPGQWCGIIAMTLASLLAGSVVARLATRTLRERMHALREATEAAGCGDLACAENALPQDFVKLSQSLARMIEQLRETAREQDRLRQQLTRSERLAVIGELAATVAHEVNNPLDGLQNCVRIIRRNPGDSEQNRQLLELMAAGLKRIETIVSRLLAMSHDGAIRAVPVPVEAVVEEAAMFVRPRLDRCRVELACDGPDDVQVLADRAQLSQVLINLLLNAADSMPEGGTAVVRWHAADGGQRAILTVSDTGCGIPETDLSRVFEPFYTTKSAEKGTGLGLAVVARIIEAHAGTITVSSELGRGTRFRIELPGVPAIADGQPAATTPSSQAASLKRVG